MPTYAITLTDEESRACELYGIDVEAWIQHAASNKARKMIDRAIEKTTALRPKALSAAERKQAIQDIPEDVETLRDDVVVDQKTGGR